MNRTGIGKDIHRLVPGRPFILGGIIIPHDMGEEGHSDGDVLTHAIMDALLGASCLGDIGELFPDNDPQWKNANSLELLRSVLKLVQKEGWRVVNIDCVITCEKPKILPYRDLIRKSLGEVFGNAELCFIKGKTAERLDAIGRGEAVEALAVCLLEKT